MLNISFLDGGDWVLVHVYTCLRYQEKQEMKLIECGKYQSSFFFFSALPRSQKYRFKYYS